MKETVSARQAREWEENVIRHVTIASIALRRASRFAELVGMDLDAIIYGEAEKKVRAQRDGILVEKYGHEEEGQRWWNSRHVWEGKDTVLDVIERRGICAGECEGGCKYCRAEGNGLGRTED